MTWIVTHQSALEFWRKTDIEGSLIEKTPCAIKPQAKPLDAKELRIEDFQGLTIPLHVLVGSDNARKVNRNLHCHICSGEFPKGSFVRMGSGLTVSPPELCFLQMADTLSLVDLIALGFELCGAYRLPAVNSFVGQNTIGNVESEDNKGFRGDLPLTSINSLNTYIAKAANLKGSIKARRALLFIADGSASPMETILAMLLTLPYKLGGYGFAKPLLNYRIEVPAGGKSTGKPRQSKYYYCDLYWPDKKVDVEYDSDAYHTGSERIAQDAIRRNALSSMGITVVTVSRIQIAKPLNMRELAEILSKLLRKRLNYPKKEFTYRQRELMRQLLPRLPANS